MSVQEPVFERQVVLLVEDDELALEAMAAMLEDEGFRVVPAACPGEAMKAFKSGGDVDVVLCDIDLRSPINGVDLGRWVQARSPEIPVLLITGAPVLPSNAATWEQQILAKPCPPSVLVTCLRSLMGHGPG